jgi:hypothetical protein
LPNILAKPLPISERETFNQQLYLILKTGQAQKFQIRLNRN